MGEWEEIEKGPRQAGGSSNRIRKQCKGGGGFFGWGSLGRIRWEGYGISQSETATGEASFRNSKRTGERKDEGRMEDPEEAGEEEEEEEEKMKEEEEREEDSGN